MKKIILTLAGFCFLFSVSFSQEIIWQNTIGGSDFDVLESLVQTPDGGYICAAISTSDISGDKTENGLGNGDWWVIKLDSSGAIQWQNTIGGSSRDDLYAVYPTADGGYICGGMSQSNISGDKTENSLGSLDYWVVKLDAAGNIQWQNTIGGSNADYFTAFAATADGGCICGGYSLSPISGDKTESNMGTLDYWVVKLDSSGNIQWDNTIGGNGFDELMCLKQTSDGGYILGGWSDSNISGDKTENSLGVYDWWIVKLDTAGVIQWQNTIGGYGYDISYAIALTTDGGYICGGQSTSGISGDKTENCMGAKDIWIVKLDSVGVILWQNTISGNDAETALSIAQTIDGGYICGALSNSNISGDKTENCLGSWDNWIIKLDPSGNIEWQNTIGGSRDDFWTRVSQTTDGSYIFGGYSMSDISGDKSENCIGNNDCWVVKLTDKYNSITGKLFIDANSNLLQDAGEPDITNKTITETATGRFSFSEQNGFYSLSVLDSGNFSVNPAVVNYYTATPANYSVNFSGIHQIDSLNNFAFQPAGVFNDLCVTITPMQNFVAGFNASYMINFENAGTTTLNPTVIFFPDDTVTFVSANVTPTAVATDSVTWNLGTLTPYQTGSILVTVNVNGGTPDGTLVNSSVRIEPVAGDANTACNYNSWEVYTVSSYDPNEILVDRDTVYTTELSSPPYLNYIIYFQNTGTAPCFNARVLNNILQRLDVSTFEFVASSHPVTIHYGAHSRLIEFDFDNINLPDSAANEPASHGFIRYRIKPLSTLIAGNKIFNRAAIYFDFHEPVMTNYAMTEIVLPTDIPIFNFQSSIFNLFPNPAREELTVSSDLLTGKNTEVKIYDLFGREVFQLPTSNLKPQTKVNVSNFSQGIYFVELLSGEKVLRGKFLKE